MEDDFMSFAVVAIGEFQEVNTGRNIANLELVVSGAAAEQRAGEAE
jgi:hypothetical protein